MSSYRDYRDYYYSLTDDEREAGVWRLLAGYVDEEENEEQLQDRNVEIAAEIFESEFTTFANRRKANLRRLSSSPVSNDINRASTFEFLLSYFKKFAVSRYVRENKIEKDLSILAYNRNCPQIVFSNYIISSTEEIVFPSDLHDLKLTIDGSNGLTAYFRTQAIKNLLISKEFPETEEALNSLRMALGTLRLYFLLNEINLFSYRDPSGKKEFFRLYLAHKQELEMEWLYPEIPGDRRKYFNLQPLLYFYPPLVRKFYEEYHLKDDRKTFVDYRKQLIPLVKEFYSCYFKSSRQDYYYTGTFRSRNKSEEPEIPFV